MSTSPVRRKKNKTWSGLVMTPAQPNPESAESSHPTSPTQRFTFSRSHSNLSNDERTPLLTNATRSRIRLGSAAGEPNGTNNGTARLSRHHSFNGMAGSTPQLGLSPTLE